MSLPDPAAPGKRVSRLPIYLVLGVLAFLVAAGAIAWILARKSAIERLDHAAADLRRAGFEVDWRDRRISGFPFRLDLTLTELRVRTPAGWSLETPRLEAEAFLHAPGNWVLATPDGLTFVRPGGGPVRISGKLLHASLTHLRDLPPNLSLEGVDLTFAPGAGAQPFVLSAAGRIEMHLRKSPDDEAGVWISVREGKAQTSGLLGGIAARGPVTFEWDSRLSNISAFAGRNWADAARHWTGAGGRMRVKRAGLTAGTASLAVTSGTLGAGGDGRIVGALEMTLREAPRALTALGQGGAIPADRAEAAVAVALARQGSGAVARATLTFQAGETTLGPVSIGPAPRIYTPN